MFGFLIDQNSLIPSKQTKCGKSALGQLKKFEECFKESTGLSAECSACYGHFTVCGKERCLQNVGLARAKNAPNAYVLIVERVS